MKHRHIILPLVSLLVAFLVSSGFATVEWDVQEVLQLEKPPLDVAVSPKGKWIFVLTGPRNILIYSPDGTLKDKLVLEKDVDGIHAGPRDDLVILSSRKDKTVRYVTLSFIQTIDISGSPYKGQADAPVAVVVFNDYQ
jgi:hypothetical protein